MRDICDRAGVSMGAVYIHYKTRDDLVIAACTLDPPRALAPDRELVKLCGGFASFLDVAPQQ